MSDLVGNPKEKFSHDMVHCSVVIYDDYAKVYLQIYIFIDKLDLQGSIIISELSLCENSIYCYLFKQILS